MSLLLPHIAARIFDTPLMVDARKAAAMLMGLGGRIVEGGVVIEGETQAVHHVAFEGGRILAGTVGDRLGRAYAKAERQPFDMVDNVAVIPVEGSLVHKGGWIGQSSGETSYQGLQAQIAAAGKDRGVKGVVLEVDSFGGEVSGAFQTADMIQQLSAAKPTLAILTDNALSAGYLLASAARQIVMPEHGNAGSIGVITLHADYSKQLESRGIGVTILKSGAFKADGNPYGPLAADVAQRWQKSLDAARQSFADAVGAHRGTRFSSSQAMDTEAMVFDGKAAVNTGLVDGIGHPNAVFDAFVAEVNRVR